MTPTVRDLLAARLDVADLTPAQGHTTAYLATLPSLHLALLSEAFAAWALEHAGGGRAWEALRTDDARPGLVAQAYRHTEHLRSTRIVVLVDPIDPEKSGHCREPQRRVYHVDAALPLPRLEGLDTLTAGHLVARALDRYVELWHAGAIAEPDPAPGRPS